MYFHSSVKLPGEDPVGCKHEYYYDDMFALIVLNALICFIRSLFDFRNWFALSSANHFS